MINVSEKLKEVFCKDCGIPIKIYKEPYFSQRLEIFDSLYDSCSKYRIFCDSFSSEKDYFQKNQCLIESVRGHIKQSLGYQEFINEDMNELSDKHFDFSRKDIYKENNVGKKFLSIDMKQANFSALSFYDKRIFDNVSTWEDFISYFTSNEHFIRSKHLRQVILGDCNSKRVVTYEKHLMGIVLDCILASYLVKRNDIVSFTNDEIIIDVTEYTQKNYLRKALIDLISLVCIPLKVTLFKLESTRFGGFVRLDVDSNDIIDLKCVSRDVAHFVIKDLYGVSITEDDKVFIHNEVLCKYLELEGMRI